MRAHVACPMKLPGICSRGYIGAVPTSTSTSPGARMFTVISPLCGGKEVHSTNNHLQIVPTNGCCCCLCLCHHHCCYIVIVCINCQTPQQSDGRTGRTTALSWKPLLVWLLMFTSLPLKCSSNLMVRWLDHSSLPRFSSSAWR